MSTNHSKITKAMLGTGADGRRVLHGMKPVHSMDKKTGKVYVRYNAFMYDGKERWEEWYSPSGEVLLRIENSANGKRARIKKGSIEAVRAINPDFISAQSEAELKKRLSILPFNHMLGVPPGVEDEDRKAEAVFLADAAPKAQAHYDMLIATGQVQLQNQT